MGLENEYLFHQLTKLADSIHKEFGAPNLLELDTTVMPPGVLIVSCNDVDHMTQTIKTYDDGKPIRIMRRFTFHIENNGNIELDSLQVSPAWLNKPGMIYAHASPNGVVAHIKHWLETQ
jgi:hypothetical protein